MIELHTDEEYWHKMDDFDVFMDVAADLLADNPDAKELREAYQGLKELDYFYTHLSLNGTSDAGSYHLWEHCEAHLDTFLRQTLGIRFEPAIQRLMETPELEYFNTIRRYQRIVDMGARQC
jgi:hypothetical protein